MHCVRRLLRVISDRGHWHTWSSEMQEECHRLPATARQARCRWRPCVPRSPPPLHGATSCGGAPVTSRRDLGCRHSACTWTARAFTRRLRDQCAAIGRRGRAAARHWPPPPAPRTHRYIALRYLAELFIRLTLAAWPKRLHWAKRGPKT